MENQIVTNQKSGFHSEFGSFVGRMASSVSLTVRRKMYQEFIRNFPDPRTVLDVGVTSESVAPEANFFEEMFPHKDRITAVGVEDAFHLEQRYPGLKFVKVRPGEALPFEAGQFDAVFSNAVIEHIVEEKDQLQFLRELMRVGQKVFLTTPNKFFPIEHHTGIPIMHFLAPRLFYSLLKRKSRNSFYNQFNLKPLGRTELQQLLGALGCDYQISPVWFAGFISNWVVVLEGRKKH